MSGIKSPSGLSLKTHAFYNFRGLDASRDKTGLDTGKDQVLTRLENAFCDWRGQIVREPGAERRPDTPNTIIEHIDFFGRDRTAWAQRDGGGLLTLNSEHGHQLPDVYPSGSVVSSTVFNSKLHFGCAGQQMQIYNGLVWAPNQSASMLKGPANLAASQRRLIVSGLPGLPTEVQFSRVDNENVFPAEEPTGSVDVLRAGFIDIRNIIGTADYITGHGPFETNRLPIFTNDQTVIYVINPDLTKWALDDRANIRVGCLSHRTIKPAGSDLMFCSRSGVHTLRRSAQNAIQLYSVPLSDRVDLLWRRLVKIVGDTANISACWDQDNGQYHVFFPQASSSLCTRLTYTENPVDPDAGKWSTGTFLQARCAASLGGQLVFGTPGGVFDIADITDITTVGPDTVIETPVLWHGSISDTKETYSFVMHATGQGTIQVEAFSDSGKALESFTVTIDEPQDDVFPDLPLSRQYERKFAHRYRGVQFRFTLKGQGLCRIIGFAVNTVQHTEKK